MNQEQKKSYLHTNYWLQYQSFFPKAFRVDEQLSPSERWWRWGEADIHLDEQTANNNKKVKFLLLHGGGGHGRLLYRCKNSIARA